MKDHTEFLYCFGNKHDRVEGHGEWPTKGKGDALNNPDDKFVCANVPSL